ncbi:MAG: HAMP domain-containing histidine kinase [Lachnospiraceae bacterium]|nr:HAMP domain-containing histidine kinase [Lachnospiraceae bacterium]
MKGGKFSEAKEIFVSPRAITLCFLGMGGLFFGIILAAAGTEAALIGVLAGAYLFLILLWLAAGGLAERRRIRELEGLLDGLSEKYLLGEVLPKPVNGMEKRYFRIMKEVSRSAIGTAEQARRDKEEYCDYVESWIHEIKTPLTACSLILDNGGEERRLRRELKRADNLTESILYYARLRTAEKDRKIEKFSVAAAMDEAVKSQMELLIGAGIGVETEGDFTVFSDRKALCFILKQLLINCAKYCPGCRVCMSAAEGVISVRDNGPGIPAHELRRVTERGFSGSPGGTGMGLYIAKELCGHLGIAMGIESAEGEYTCVTLAFPL